MVSNSVNLIIWRMMCQNADICIWTYAPRLKLVFVSRLNHSASSAVVYSEKSCFSLSYIVFLMDYLLLVLDRGILSYRTGKRWTARDLNSTPQTAWQFFVLVDWTHNNLRIERMSRLLLFYWANQTKKLDSILS
jgi:hypothetical protein